MRCIITVFIVMCVTFINCYTQEEPGPEAAKLLNDVSNLDQGGKIDEALTLLDQGLEKFTNQDYDRFFILNYKYIILMRDNNYSEALPLVVEKANIIKSPKQALQVAETYLKIKDTDRALDWIRTSVDRGLQSYTVFNKEDYDPIRESKQFSDLLATIERRIRLGSPAKPFLRETISGQEVSLDKYKGKVLLVDFWATFCAPCIKEMPNLKECYKLNKEKGFEIIGFSMDKDEDRLKQYLDTNEVSWETVICTEGEKDETIILYQVVNIPASFLIDRNGILRYVNLIGDDLKKAIEELINE